MEFSELLKDLRREAGLTQVEVTEKLGISQSAYASWERGIKNNTRKFSEDCAGFECVSGLSSQKLRRKIR